MKKILIFFLIFNLAFAQGIQEVQNKILSILGNIIKFLFIVLMIAAGGLLIFLGIKYILAKGKVEELHSSLLYIILGIVLIILSLFLPNFIKNFIESVTK